MRNDKLNADAMGRPTAPMEAEHPLGQALLESRQRWQALVAMAADFAYETDSDGRFVFISTEFLLGWAAQSLLGQMARSLLASPGIGFDPFTPGMVARGQRVWLRQADGTAICCAVTCQPIVDFGGAGSRGLVQDITAQDARDAAIAASLRRSDVMDHILWRMRREVLATSMMQAVLESLLAAMGAQGAAVVNLLSEPVIGSVLHCVGDGIMTLLPAIHAMIPADAMDTLAASLPEDRPMLACPSLTRFGERAALTLWRAPGARAWDADEILLASSATAIIRIVLEHDSIQRELARQARTDPLTGLLNRRSFLEEMNRRVERLDREGLPGTLMFVDLDFFKALNDACGHEVGDEALTLTAQLLRDTVRPADLVARLGGDEFALWLDGSDQLTAAERGERLRLGAPGYFARELPPGAPALSMSIGIACRRPGDMEDLEVLMHRADSVMYEVKRNGRGHWKVAHEGFFP
jgi:diguanylate cyclase (GGDEF)-like protein/PAS domain S-box-containing protein